MPMVAFTNNSKQASKFTVTMRRFSTEQVQGVYFENRYRKE